MVDMVMDTMDTMVRDLLMLKLSQLPLLNLAMDIMVMDTDMAMATDMAMDTTDIMEKDLLKRNQDMDTMAMDMATDTMDIMARGLLNLAMDTMAMDTDMDMV